MSDVNLSIKNKLRLIFYPLFLSVVVYIAWPKVAAKYFDNGFDLSNVSVDRELIFHGGPVKDGIPSLDHPDFVSVREANYLAGDDRVLGVSRNGIAKAYPIKILDHHEIVNDTFAGEKLVISYCPLCGTGMVFESHINGLDLEFGVSGLLYNSDVLLYDRQTHSLWSQILSHAISGEYQSAELKQIPAYHGSWQQWLEKHPQTEVLSIETGFNRNYHSSPYMGYQDSESIYFPVQNVDKRYHPKEWVVGLKVQEQTKAYPFSELSQSVSPLLDQFNGVELQLVFDSQNRSARAYDQNGRELPVTLSYWFAWMAFYPQSEVYQSKKDGNNPESLQ